MNPDSSPTASSTNTNTERQTVSRRYLILATIFIILGMLASFLSGYIFKGVTQSPATGISPTPLPINIPNATGETYSPGRFYFNDTLIMVSTDGSSFALAATAARQQSDSGYVQNSNISYFNGKDWKRQTAGNKTDTSAIYTNNLIKSWSVNVDPSRVLKQSVSAEFTLPEITVSIETGQLNNEIGMRSLPGYTKFMSQVKTKAIVNGQSTDVYLLYTRIYSSNSTDIQFYTAPLGLTTDWLAAWDSTGNFYHLDSTFVDKPTDIYQTHQIGIREDISGTVSKTFSVTVNRDPENNPVNYLINLNNPVNTKLSFTRKNLISKAQGWTMGIIEGHAEDNTGIQLPIVGLVEYIKD